MTPQLLAEYVLAVGFSLLAVVFVTLVILAMILPPGNSVE